MKNKSKRQQDQIRAAQRGALGNVVNFVGSQTKLGDIFGVSYQAVQSWYKLGVPLQHCPVLETLTAGAVQCEDLNHDFRELYQRPYRLLKNIYRDGDKSRIYIAGPMAGYPELSYPAFHAEAARLRAAGLNVISPAEIKLSGEPTWNDFMRADIAQMMKCSAVCLLPGWENSPDARLEHQIATTIDNFTFMLAGDGV